jgi:hypothetical protein
MALSTVERDTLRNLVERWLVLNADAEDATLTIRLAPGGPTIETIEKKRLTVAPDEVLPPPG